MPLSNLPDNSLPQLEPLQDEVSTPKTTEENELEQVKKSHQELMKQIKLKLLMNQKDISSQAFKQMLTGAFKADSIGKNQNQHPEKKQEAPLDFNPKNPPAAAQESDQGMEDDEAQMVKDSGELGESAASAEVDKKAYIQSIINQLG
jgi:hypothetical protein